MDPLFLAELNERLFVHFSQGLWRAPLGQRLLPVRPEGVARWGQIVCGDTRDAQRALSGVAVGGVPDGAGLTAAWARASAGAARLRAIEGFTDQARGEPPLGPVPGPLIVLSAADAPLPDLVALLIARAAQGVVWKPAPRAAASAHYVMRALAPAAAGRLALVQGDHRSGADLARHGTVIWASEAPVPADLTPLVSVPVVRAWATDPRRR